MPIWMQSGNIAVTAPTYNPVLTSGAIGVTGGGTWAPYLLSGVIAIGTDILDAFIKDGGSVFAENQIVSIDGNPLTPESVLEPPQWQELEDDESVRFPLKLAGADYSYLDHAVMETTAPVTIDQVVRYASTGEYTTYRLFTGVIQSPEDQFSESPASVGNLIVESIAAKVARKKLTISLNLDTRPYSVVVFGVEDECEVLALDSTATVTIKAGRVLLPFGTLGQVAQRDIAETTLDLSTYTTITMSGDDAVGTKSIFVAGFGGGPYAGRLIAADGPCPPDGCPLYSFDLQYEGQVLTADRFIDQRDISVPYEERTRSRILKLVLDREGITTSALTFPTTNDDQVNNPIQCIETPLLSWVKQWLEPSLWQLKWDRNGNPRVTQKTIKRSPVGADWDYDQNNVMTATVTGPPKNEACADVTVRGMQRINHGLTSRVEETETTDYAEVSDTTASSRATLGGEMYTHGTTVKLKPVRKTKRKKWFLGNAIVLEKSRVYLRRNPIDYRTDIVAKATALPVVTWNSSEWCMDHLYDRPMLVLSEETEVEHNYKGRIYRGWKKTEKRLRNRTSFSAGAIRGPGLPISGVGYGWESYDEDMIVVSVVEHAIEPTADGFIDNEMTTEYAQFNPQVNGESGGGYGNAGISSAIGATGYNSETEELIKVSEMGLKYKRRNSEEIEIQRYVKSWRKEPNATAHGAIGGYSEPAGGHVQATLSGMTREVEVKKGTRPAVTSLEDDIERIPVGVRLASSTLESGLDIDKTHNELHEYVETEEMAQRLAAYRMGKFLAVRWSFLVPLNPAMQLGDTVRLRWDTRGGLYYDYRGVVTGIVYATALAPTDAGSQLVTIDQDYNDVKTTLAARV